jgi:4-amino-4-deoxy-L-arabinose transferase-like glycosyltransferase
MKPARRTLYKNSVLFLFACLLAVGYAVKRANLPCLDSIDDYGLRALLYREWMNWFFILAVPSVLIIAWIFSRTIPGKNVAQTINRTLDTLPNWVFMIVLPVLFLGVAGITAHRMIGATPRVLDSFNYLFQAENFSRGQLYAQVPPVKDCFQFPFIIMQDGRWYGSVYPGFPFLLALGVLACIPWMVNPFLGGIGMMVVYLAGRKFFDESLARRAVLLLAVSPFYRMISSIFMSHVAAMLWALLSISLLWRWITEGRSARAVIPFLAAVALGFNYITRPQTAAVVVAPFLFLGFVRTAKRKISMKHLAVFLFVLAVFYTGLSGYNRMLTGDPDINPRYAVDPGRRLGFGRDIGETLPGGVRGGHSLSKGFKNVEILLNLWNSDMFGWGASSILGICFVMVWCALILPNHKMIEWLLGVGIGCNCLLYIFYFTPSPNFGPRYLSGIIPATVLLTVSGARKLVQAVSRRGWDLAGINREFVTLSTLLLVIGAAVFVLPVHTYHYGQLPPMTARNSVPQFSQDENILVLIPDEFYTLNIFTWNSPDLDGIIFLRNPGAELVAELRRAFPDRCFFLVDGYDSDRQWKGTTLHPLIDQ